MEINVGEYGYALNCNANYNLSLASSLHLEIKRPDGTLIEATPVLGTADVTIPGKGTFAANNYAKYTVVAGDLNQVGEYITRLTYTDATKKLISVPDSFMVYA